MSGHPLVSGLVEFVVSYLLIMALPGANVLVVADAAAAGPRRAALAAAAGIGCGAALLALAAASGMSVLTADPRTATLGKLLLAAILVAIGLRALRRACLVSAAGRPMRAMRSPGRFCLGALTAATNPVTAVFFVSASARMGEGGAGLGVALAPALVFVLATGWFGAIGLAFSSRRVRELHVRRRREVNLAVGALLVCVGAFTALRLLVP